MTPVVAIANSAFSDRERLVEHFGKHTELRFCDISTPALIEESTKGAAALVVTLQPLRAEHIGALSSSVRVIGRAGVGLDSVDLGAAESCGLTVVNQPGYGSREVASHAVAMLLSLERKLSSADAYVRGGWKGSFVLSPMKAVDELVVGLVGCGRIGSAVAEMLSCIVAEVLIYDPAPVHVPAGAERVAHLEELLQRSDAVSLHVPLTAETEGLVEAGFLAKLRRGAVLVNVSRGGLVDEEALVKALKEGELAGAALDVFHEEPLPATSSLLSVPNTLLSPHCAAYSDRSAWRLATWTIADMLGWIRTGTVEHGEIVVRGTR